MSGRHGGIDGAEISSPRILRPQFVARGFEHTACLGLSARLGDGYGAPLGSTPTVRYVYANVHGDVTVLHIPTMGRPKKTDRSSVAVETLTLRLTSEDRRLLDELVRLRTHELADDAITLTAASYVRGLIKREAKAKGLVPANSPTRSGKKRR